MILHYTSASAILSHTPTLLGDHIFLDNAHFLFFLKYLYVYFSGAVRKNQGSETLMDTEIQTVVRDWLKHLKGHKDKSAITAAAVGNGGANEDEAL